MQPEKQPLTRMADAAGASPEGVRPRKIIHVDMDAFYASVEQRDNPELRGRPVIVGGRPNGRGVVAACSYEARKFGIRSAMPSAEAGRRCPHAVFVKPRFETYVSVSARVHTVFREFTDVVEPLSLDEAYLDVSNVELLGGSATRIAEEIRAMILERTGLVASAGVSYNKALAKLASDHNKPNGLFCVLPGEGEAFVAALPVGRLHGVGRVTEERMHSLGIQTGADLCAWSLVDLEREFGNSARRFHDMARGIDERPVRVSRVRKSIGSERTFSENLVSPEAMLDVLKGLADEVFDSLESRELQARTLTAKVRFADFQTLTRGYSVSSGALDRRGLHRALPYLLARALAGASATGDASPQVRLLGVSLGGLSSRDDSEPRQLEFDGI